MELKSKGRLSTFVLFIFIQNVHHIQGTITGDLIGCGREGTPVEVDILTPNCFSCMCVHGFVQCKSKCEPIDGCYALEKTANSCCPKCKGCMYEGIYYASNTEWKDPNNPCMVYHCHAGVVTQIEVQCRTPCKNPSPPKPGQCCGTCPDCPKLKNHRGLSGRQIMLSDPCLKCPCSQSSGMMMCTKKACPVLDCPESKLWRNEGECCPKCSGKNEVTSFPVPNTCLAFKKFFKEDETIVLDHCTKCTCKNGTMICNRKTCPVLDCPPIYQKLPPNSCCKECRNLEELESYEERTLQCTFHGQTLEEDEVKELDDCTMCKCSGGLITCDRIMCNESMECPFGSFKVHEPKECCSKCIEKPGTCVVFGDPHYKTFDGQFYTFKGNGKYQLTADCKDHSFSIRVANAYQTKSSSSATTKRVSIKVSGLRINLGQKLVAKIDGVKIPFPYEKDKVVIDKLNDTLQLRLRDEIKIVWNGRSFLEVTVPPRYKNKLCGLCGNFNVNSQDDLKDRRGRNFSEHAIQHFGNAWCVGKSCSNHAHQPKTCTNKRKHDRKYCDFFNSSSSFERCRTKNNLEQFYSACLMDMCDCPDGKCYCESLMAYAQECKRLNIDVSGWQKACNCESFNRTQRKFMQKRPRKNHKLNHLLNTIKSKKQFSNSNITYARYFPNKVRNSKMIPLSPE
ncbi:BMP-binding endothelial regulator protein-like [Onthophagus taurus]|uniref:BMP-binding endothelial regulator protein-like n=1 Tax=Onthophagus taurus TaxID=166361 RepID=UPI000C20DBAD|nr:BMP-binding endothelial regulator protein-like [Onthophagus taurus]